MRGLYRFNGLLNRKTPLSCARRQVGCFMNPVFHRENDEIDRRSIARLHSLAIVVSTKDKIDPAALQRMEKKIDHSIHLLESLT